MGCRRQWAWAQPLTVIRRPPWGHGCEDGLGSLAVWQPLAVLQVCSLVAAVCSLASAVFWPTASRILGPRSKVYPSPGVISSAHGRPGQPAKCSVAQNSACAAEHGACAAEYGAWAQDYGACAADSGACASGYGAVQQNMVPVLLNMIISQN